VSDVCAFTFKDAASNRRERERWGGGRKRNATIGRKKKRKRERETETKRKRERGGGGRRMGRIGEAAERIVLNYHPLHIPDFS
jgi:hypothetical protein